MGIALTPMVLCRCCASSLAFLGSSIAKQSLQTELGTGGKQKLSTQPHEANCLDTSVGLREGLGLLHLGCRVPFRPPRPNPIKLFRISWKFRCNILTPLTVGKRALAPYVASWKGCLERSVEDPVGQAVAGQDSQLSPYKQHLRCAKSTSTARLLMATYAGSGNEGVLQRREANHQTAKGPCPQPCRGLGMPLGVTAHQAHTAVVVYLHKALFFSGISEAQALQAYAQRHDEELCGGQSCSHLALHLADALVAAVAQLARIAEAKASGEAVTSHVFEKM